MSDQRSKYHDLDEVLSDAEQTTIRNGPFVKAIKQLRSLLVLTEVKRLRRQSPKPASVVLASGLEVAYSSKIMRIKMLMADSISKYSFPKKITEE